MAKALCSWIETPTWRGVSLSSQTDTIENSSTLHLPRFCLGIPQALSQIAVCRCSTRDKSHLTTLLFSSIQLVSFFVFRGFGFPWLGQSDRLAPHFLQNRASISWRSLPQPGQAGESMASIFRRVRCAVTMPVGTAMMP